MLAPTSEEIDLEKIDEIDQNFKEFTKGNKIDTDLLRRNKSK